MKLSIYRAIPLVLALDVAALLVSGIPRFKHAHHGLDAVVGEIVWLAFLAGLLALLVLAAIALTRARRARRAHA
jgi:hypothetical protein